MPSHVIYIDDSGTKEYADDPNEYEKSRRGRSRHFLFCGVLTTTAHAGVFRDRIIALKQKCFRASDVEVKSNWLRIPDERQKRYLDKYGITEDQLTDFVDAYYDLINDSDISLIAAVVDKRHMQEKYPKPWYTPAIAYELLLQR